MKTKNYYQLAKSGNVKLLIFTVSGQNMKTLVYNYQQGDGCKQRQDGGDEFGRQMNSGV